MGGSRRKVATVSFFFAEIRIIFGAYCNMLSIHMRYPLNNWRKTKTWILFERIGLTVFYRTGQIFCIEMMACKAVYMLAFIQKITYYGDWLCDHWNHEVFWRRKNTSYCLWHKFETWFSWFASRHIWLDWFEPRNRNDVCFIFLLISNHFIYLVHGATCAEMGIFSQGSLLRRGKT